MGGGMGEGRSGGGEMSGPDPVNTCANCHGQAMDAYSPSVHAAAFRRGTPHAPSCVECHGSHSVKAVSDPQSAVSKFRVSEETCARCHGPASVMAIHGLQTNAVPDYRQSFHGLSAALGDQRVATCASCHGNHEIRPSRDPLSTVSAAKMYQTCAACHAGTTLAFATGGVHHNPALTGHKLVDIAGFLYLMAIVIVIGSMLLHNGLDFWGRLTELWTQRRGKLKGSKPSDQQAIAPAATGDAESPAQKAAGESQSHLRFNVIERVQHWTLAASFGLLALTGFALKYTWRIPFLEAQRGALLRGRLHRGAAIVLITLAIFHAGYMLLTRRGRYNLRAFLPRIRSARDFLVSCVACLRLGPPSRADWRDLIQTVKYNLGLVPARPAMGRFTYAEKMEYLALLWGSGVMIVTGLMLWFKVPFLNRFQYWVYDLVTTVHYYEALLATLAIFAWHFYYTIYNPDVFPLSTTMVTGRISHEEMERDHALELRMLEEEAAKKEPDS
jgi:cytochrome b subunit of formate dehydrogenase